MAKSADNTVLDAPFDVIITAAGTTNRVKEVLCGTEPTTYAQANATYMLASVVMVAGDFTKAANDTTGRKCTVAAKTGVTVTTPGTANWVCLIDTTSSLILAKTSCAAKALTDTVDIAAWAIRDPQPV